MGDFEQRISQLGIEIPAVPAPQACYVPAVKINNLVQTAGQLPVKDGRIVYSGKVGCDLSLEEGMEAARLACLNCLAVIKSVIGSLDWVEQILMVRGFVNSAPGFTNQHLVLDGASNFLKEVFGVSGTHARVAVGVSDLPRNAAIEIEILASFR